MKKTGETKLRVTELSFNDGSQVSVEPGVVLIVGPNNAGKSRSLSEIRGGIGSPFASGAVVTEVKHQWLEVDEIEHWANKSLGYRDLDGERHYNTPSGSVTLGSLRQSLGSGQVAALINRLILFADGSSRLNAGTMYTLSDTMGEPSEHPMFKLFRSVSIEEELDGLSRSAFRTGALVDRYMINGTVCIRIGDRPDADFIKNVPTDNYLEQLRKLPLLDGQGDGVRAYLGLLLHVLAGVAEVILVDEPEAFLHPPQARRLGRVLSNRSESQQLIAATHSADFLRGVLDGSGRISVVRLMRKGLKNHAAALDAELLKEMWADPLLKYSNIFDGLFHDGVILCESDADCTYYSAVLNTVYSSEVDDAGLDILFTQSSTKDRFATVVRALRAVRVPCVVVGDIDLLREQNKLKTLVEAFGGNFDDMAGEYSVATQALEARSPLRRLALREAVIDHLDEIKGAELNSRDIKSLRDLLRTESGWDRLKHDGLTALPAGPQTVAFRRLLETLGQLGIMVVPVGELERFVPEVGGHGPSWVTGVLEAGHHLRPSEEAKNFIQSVRDAVDAAVTRATGTL